MIKITVFYNNGTSREATLNSNRYAAIERIKSGLVEVPAQFLTDIKEVHLYELSNAEYELKHVLPGSLSAIIGALS